MKWIQVENGVEELDRAGCCYGCIEAGRVLEGHFKCQPISRGLVQRLRRGTWGKYEYRTVYENGEWKIIRETIK